jgi:virginiamycin B lyase
MIHGLAVDRARRPVILWLLVLSWSLLMTTVPRPAHAAAGQIKEFLIPGNTPGPQEITVGSDGALWFTEINAGIGRLGKAGFSNFPLPGRQALGIAAGPDGALWFTEIYGDAIGRITTAGQITEFPLCSGCGGGKIQPWDIAAGPDGALWFTEYQADAIGRITTSGQITTFPVPGALARPLAITSGPDGALWFGGGSGIGRITTAGAISQVTTEGAGSITTGPDGNLWFAATRPSSMGRLTPSTGQIRFFPTSTACSPQYVAAGAGSLWFGCYSVDQVDRMSTTGVLTRFAVPHHFTNYPDTIEGIVEGPDHAMWFAEYAAERIGRVSTS